MKLFDRVLLAVYSLVLVALSLLALMMAAGWTTPINYMEIYFNHLQSRWIIGITAALLLLVGLNLFFSNFQRRRTVPAAVSHHTQFGEVRLSITALENLVHRASRKIAGVKEINPRVRPGSDGVTVLIQAILLPDQSIPKVSEQLQQQVKDYLQEAAGLDVAEIKVVVQNVSHEGKVRVE
ncbi:alkaline shock response membrane anchor protein AmaP [Metallumcola ferriviriculae]|uniref:Alkaline shock response membrane anchor protein AmaP n=1 Tax=Metallumcola ferriviriculae TaxID=3039180 RepID=A0AAU0UPS2_9FIRM|nr:alkaline shock response membrane anchor protein AmaP [Desulfitibacteraceae bacterium MK1]